MVSNCRLKAAEKIITIVQEIRENGSETSFKEFIKNLISVKRVRDRTIKTTRGPRLIKESKTTKGMEMQRLLTPARK